MDRIVEQNLLYDFYGELLTAHQKEIYGEHILNDMTATEIAAEFGITRQAVHDMIRRCDKILADYEARLHLVEKFLCIRKQVQKIKELAVGYNAGEITEISNKILEEL